MELLFESRTNLGGMSGDLRFFQRRPDLHPEPVLVPDSVGDESGVSIYGSVHDDGGRLRMWYYAVPRQGETRADGAFVAYAESADGIEWTKPSLDLPSGGPAGANLTNLGLHSATVFIDPDSPPDRRYRGVGCGRDYTGGNAHNLQQRGYYTAHSADGLKWTLDSPQPRWLSSDVITSIYNSQRRCGMVSLKFTPRLMRMARRSIHTAEFRDGQYTDHVPTLYPDDFDDVCAAARGYHSCDYYGMGMMPAGQACVGFLWKYWHAMPYSQGWGNGRQALYGTSDVSLVYQPQPGAAWMHLPGRPNFIGHEDLPWSCGWVNTASNVVTVGDQHRLYYSGRMMPHGFGLDETWKPRPDCPKLFEKSGITFASWPKWRLFGFEGLAGATLKIQLGRIDRPSRIRLNYETIGPNGAVRCELLGADNKPLPGRTMDECKALTGDQIAGEVAWTEGSVIQPAESARLSLDFRFARVYAYSVESV